MTYAVTCFISDSLLFYLGPKLLSDYTYMLHVLKFIATVWNLPITSCSVLLSLLDKTATKSVRIIEIGFLFYAFQAILVKFYFVKQF